MKEGRKWRGGDVAGSRYFEEGEGLESFMHSRTPSITLEPTQYHNCIDVQQMRQSIIVTPAFLHSHSFTLPHPHLPYYSNYLIHVCGYIFCSHSFA